MCVCVVVVCVCLLVVLRLFAFSGVVKEVGLRRLASSFLLSDPPRACCSVKEVGLRRPASSFSLGEGGGSLCVCVGVVCAHVSYSMV